MQKPKNPILTRSLIPMYLFIVVGVVIVLLWELYNFSNPTITLAYCVAGIAIAAATKSKLDREKRKQQQNPLANE